MITPVATDRADIRLRVMARFARFCLAQVELLLRIEPLFRLACGGLNTQNKGITTLTLIAAVTRITVIAATLMRYVETPRPPARHSHIRNGINVVYRLSGKHFLELPLGQDVFSIMTLKICAQAQAMISRDQLYRFGDMKTHPNATSEPAKSDVEQAVIRKPVNSFMTSYLHNDGARTKWRQLPVELERRAINQNQICFAFWSNSDSLLLEVNYGPNDFYRSAQPYRSRCSKW